MSFRVKPLKKSFQDLVNDIKQWFKEDEPIKNNLSLDSLIKSFIVIIPIHGILYLWHYYSIFGTQYFLYFNPVDFINIFYSNNITLLTFSLVIGFVFVHFLLNFEATLLLKVKTNILLFALFLIVLIILFSIWFTTTQANFYVVILMSIFLFAIAVKYKQTRLIYYFLVFFYFSHTVSLAKHNASIVKKSKPNFTIILNDNSYALKQDSINRKDYFIGKVTDYVFIYSDSIKSVRVIPIGEVKEIQFPLDK